MVTQEQLTTLVNQLKALAEHADMVRFDYLAKGEKSSAWFQGGRDSAFTEAAEKIEDLLKAEA